MDIGRWGKPPLQRWAYRQGAPERREGRSPTREVRVGENYAGHSRAMCCLQMRFLHRAWERARKQVVAVSRTEKNLSLRPGPHRERAQESHRLLSCLATGSFRLRGGNC